MIWNSFDIPVGRVCRWQIGPLDLWIQHLSSEWCSASKLTPDRITETRVLAEEEIIPSDLEVRRWLVKDREEFKVTLRPTLPDRAVVVRPALPVTVLPGSEACFLVSIPIWVEVFIGSAEGEKLLAVPTVVLSNSWFGLPSEGEVCYALRTRARRAAADLDLYPHRAICPMTVKNEAVEPLLVQRLFLRTAPLAIYAGTEHLWTNAATYRYQGELKPTAVVYAGKAPDYDKAGPVLHEPREKVHNGFLARSFSGLREAIFQ